MDDETLKKYSPIVLRLGIAGLFLWFGLNQLFDSSSWISFLPSWTNSLPISQNSFVLINGIFETVLGLTLLVGFATRISALLLSLHLLGIVSTLGYNDLMIRDLALSIATFTIFMNGTDEFCLEEKLKK